MNMRSQTDLDRTVANDEALLDVLGARVREARAGKKMPRRVLAELSDVSPRYLAQLEAGKGNISILLLYRIAVALDLSLSDLLRAPGADSEGQLIKLFQRSDPSTQTAVIQRLEAGANAPGRAQRLCLIGLRGAGKSTLGSQVGAALDVPFIELNREIEAQGGMPVAEIMALYGAQGYRQLEAEAVNRIAARHDRIILAVAGGIVSEPQTFEALLAGFHTVWVQTTPEEHMARVRAQGDSRPMEGRPGAMGQLRDLLRVREGDYARAQAVLNTSGKTERQSLRELRQIIDQAGFLG